jgi:hypothetical protein
MPLSSYTSVSLLRERQLRPVSPPKEDCMATHRVLDPDNFPNEAQPESAEGHDLRSLGPGDSSDSGSDLIGPGLVDDDHLGLDRGTSEDTEGGHWLADAGASVGDLDLDSTSDRSGTGERMAAGKEPQVRMGGDIAPDRIVGPEEAGLGAGLDQAEEARYGITDEELAREQAASDGRKPGS